MKFWSSCECSQDVLENLVAVAEVADLQIAEILAQLPGKFDDWEFCYIPICMSEDFAEFYPARSHVDWHERRICNSPVLIHATLAAVPISSRRAEYIAGVISDQSLFEQAGLTEGDTRSFAEQVKLLVESEQTPDDRK